MDRTFRGGFPGWFLGKRTARARTRERCTGRVHGSARVQVTVHMGCVRASGTRALRLGNQGPGTSRGGVAYARRARGRSAGGRCAASGHRLRDPAGWMRRPSPCRRSGRVCARTARCSTEGARGSGRIPRAGTRCLVPLRLPVHVRLPLPVPAPFVPQKQAPGSQPRKRSDPEEEAALQGIARVQAPDNRRSRLRRWAARNRACGVDCQIVKSSQGVERAAACFFSATITVRATRRSARTRHVSSFPQRARSSRHGRLCDAAHVGLSDAPSGGAQSTVGWRQVPRAAWHG